MAIFCAKNIHDLFILLYSILCLILRAFFYLFFVNQPGRVPIIPYPIAELASDDGEGNSSKKSDAFIPNSLSR
jgi:hypothetical protein